MNELPSAIEGWRKERKAGRWGGRKASNGQGLLEYWVVHDADKKN